MSVRILIGDCRQRLAGLPSKSVNTCVTSPPYFGLRDYGVDGQIGLEDTPAAFVAQMVDVFREVRRVLRDDGTLWLNLGDSWGTRKQLLGIPRRVAFALQADGWILRQELIWSKPNPMPESVTDRCTKAHEYLFLLAKLPRYYYDAEAISEEAAAADFVSRYRTPQVGKNLTNADRKDGDQKATGGFASDDFTKRNKRSVWTVGTAPFKEAHFATYPPALIEPCILAGCPQGGTVLDPFGGAGTTGLVADRLQRDAILIELNPEYAAIAERRLRGDGGMFSVVEAA